MKPRQLLSTLAILTLPFSVSAQCSFDTDKSQPGFELIKQTIGTATQQWKMAIGKNSGKYYLWMYVVDGSASKHKMNSNDFVFLDLASGERLSFTPMVEVAPELVTKGSAVTTRYNTRFEIDKGALERLSSTNVDKVLAVIDNREISCDVNEAQISKIKEAATCVLK